MIYQRCWRKFLWQLSLVITKEMVGKRAKGREVKFIRKKVEEPQFAIGTYLYIFDHDGVFCAIWSNHVIHQDRKEVFFNAVPWTEWTVKWPTEVIRNTRYTVIRVIANSCHTRRQKWKKATFVPKKAWILDNLYRFFDMILISQKDQYDISCQLARWPAFRICVRSMVTFPCYVCYVIWQVPSFSISLKAYYILLAIHHAVQGNGW